MKTFTVRLLLFLGLLLTFAATGRGEESHRGFFEADLAGGGKAVFFVQGNHAISIYVFDVATSTASFAGGDIADDGTFSVVASNGATITGSVHDDDNPEAFDDDQVTATIGSQTVTGIRSRILGRVMISQDASPERPRVRPALRSRSKSWSIHKTKSSLSPRMGVMFSEGSASWRSRP